MDQPFKPWILQIMWEQLEQIDEFTDGSPKPLTCLTLHPPAKEAG